MVKVVLYFVAKFSFQKFQQKDLRSKSKSCENVPNVEELIIILNDFPSIYLAGFLLSGVLLLLDLLMGFTTIW